MRRVLRCSRRFPARKYSSEASSSWTRLRGAVGWPGGRTDDTMAPPPGTDKKPEKSYLSSTIDSIYPWSGSSTAPAATPDDPPPHPSPPTNPADHSTRSVYGRSFRRYPPDCPPLKVQWFHAVDVSSFLPRPVCSCCRSPLTSMPGSQTKTRVAEGQEAAQGDEAPSSAKEVCRLLRRRQSLHRSRIPEGFRECGRRAKTGPLEAG